MRVSNSDLFHFSPESWLGCRLDDKLREMVVSPKKALSCECRPQKGESVPEWLEESLRREQSAIAALPDAGVALRSDRIEALRAREFGVSQNPSVDVCIRVGAALMLLECKYKAHPETSIVRSLDAFRCQVSRKFEASQAYYAHEGAESFLEDRIVLFNGDSKDKVLSMFKRLLLQDDDASLRCYSIMDTSEFCAKYEDSIV